MHHIKEASQNACLCLFLCINIIINSFGSYLSSVSLLLAYILTFINSSLGVPASRGRVWIYSFEWLVLIRQISLLSAACQGITEILVLLSRPHPLDSLIPTLYLPKEIISIFIVVLILVLLCFGLEGSPILDGLVYGCITGAVVLYTISSLSIHASGNFASPLPSPFELDQILLICGLLKPFFIETSLFGPSSRIWTNTFIFVIYFFITVFMPSFEQVMCIDEGLIALLCPINSRYKWYELSMGCLALIGFASLAPSLASKPVLSLVTPSRLGIHFTSEGTNMRQNNVKALVFLGLIICPLTYWAHIYHLFYVNSIACWLQELISSLSHLFYYYTPVHVHPENLRAVANNSPYERVTGITEELPQTSTSSFQDVVLSDSESSDTDIDSIVEEYHDKIKVLQGTVGPVRKIPTEVTGKTSYFCLVLISGFSLCISFSLILQFYILAFYTALGLVLLIIWLLWLPRRSIADFKTTVILIMNFSLANLMIVPLFNFYSMIITSLLLLIGIILFTAPYVKNKITVVKISVQLKCITDSLYSTKVFNVQRKSTTQT